jgi:hypothetical protein
MTVNQAIDRIITALKRAGYRAGNIRRDRVVKSGFIVADGKDRTIAVFYEEPENHRPHFELNPMLQAYREVLLQAGFSGAVVHAHGVGGCTIHPEHVHINV